MCGIYGYIGINKHDDAAKKVVEGLGRLSYRGYDSWGVAELTDSGILVKKDVGEVPTKKPAGLGASAVAIGHTRWATHGGVTRGNAHPHAASDGSFVLAQNGIVENYVELKAQLKPQFKFKTQTDTEIIVRLLEKEKKSAATLREALRATFLQLEGRNTVIVLADDGTMVTARNGSPLVVGRGAKGALYFSSDTLSFAGEVSEVLVVENGQMVEWNGSDLTVYALDTGEAVPLKFEKLTVVAQKADKAGYDHFMLKEIHESPDVLSQVVAQDLVGMKELARVIDTARTVYTLGSGTAGIASAQIAYYLRKIGKVNTISLIGAEAQSYYDLFGPGDVILAPSQSGETADVLEVLELAQEKGVQIATYVNMSGSMMTRMADFPFMAGAGPEFCVMSTKVFTSQIAWGYLLAKLIAGEHTEGTEVLAATRKALRAYLEDPKATVQLKKLAKKLVPASSIFLLGKSQNMEIIKEGMVKMIEGSYNHAHGIPAGDLKHYAITLMETGVPVIVAISNDEARTDSISAGIEVQSRGATVIGIGQGSVAAFNEFIELPDTGETAAIVNVVALQLLAYYMTVELGNNVDKPRNIAKSVTVK